MGRYRYGLVGEKLGHSFSPMLHKAFGNYEYGLIEIGRGDIDDFFERADFDAVNVTIPYKETAMSHCLPDEVASDIGCVNTLVRTADGVKGYNTDTYGFEYMASSAGISFSGAKVTILGSGGTCRTAAYTAGRLGAAHITVVSRHPSDMGLNIPCPASYVGYDGKYDECDILVNTTPIGMYPDIDRMPIDISNSYVNLKAYIDVIYNPLSTRLAYRAKKKGIASVCGLPMLVAQGFFASKLFMGEDIGSDPVGSMSGADREVLEGAVRAIREKTGNIVLTGMPGSGKSTVGKALAQKLGLDYADTDEIFRDENGMKPSECIRLKGESTFRRLEKKAVCSAAKTGGRVIATGGGVVLDPENMEMLSLNGRTVFLNRKLEELATRDRPLSEGSENLKGLYYRRLPIYLANCEFAVNVEGDVGSVADTVAHELAGDRIRPGGAGENRTGGNEIGGAGLHNIPNRSAEENLVKRDGCMNILIINGPNLNMLGIREPDIYGSNTYDDLMRLCRKKAEELGICVRFYQSNHEGDLVDIIQQAYGMYNGIVINPGAYTHTSVAILDALKAVGIPAVEVHISDVGSREDFRQTSYIRQYVRATITGHGFAGYTEAMELLSGNVQADVLP
ncbi:MAG: type II 3-dehydroquinate dehydratase [Lachnospiraceae bacterium]|nr:type II 3-dehydroquinate dehydratase [Lachnospiraceae bacterium]